jgi:hypothetical protein
MAAFFLPWQSLTRESTVFVHPTVVNDGFSGWGWLSFAAALVATALVVRLVTAKGTLLGAHLDSRMLACITVAAGLTELLGNVLFIATAPKTEIFISAGQVAGRRVGLDIAMVAGVVLIASGLLMFAPNKRHSPAELAEADARAGTVLLFPALVFLAGVFDEPPFPLGFERLLRLGMDELRRMAGDARHRGVALRGRTEGWGHLRQRCCQPANGVGNYGGGSS